MEDIEKEIGEIINASIADTVLYTYEENKIPHKGFKPTLKRLKASEAKKELLALIHKACNEARVDELESLKEYASTLTKPVIQDRIKELKEISNG